MPMKIITGGTGCGKSSCLYRLMLDNLNEHKGSRAVLIVPEQFSYTAEKTLSEAVGGLGINNIEVMTFSRLINRIAPRKNPLLESGKTMLLQKCAKSVSEGNVFRLSSSRIGFINALSDLFSEFERYGISPDDFADMTADNPHTAKKLSSVNELYRIYTDSLPDGFSSEEDAISVFAELVERQRLDA